MKRPPILARAILRGLVRFPGERAASLVPQPRLAGPVPWVMAIMTALMVLAAAGGLTLTNVAEGARAELAGGLTVQIVEPDPAARERQAAAAAAVLARAPAVASFRRVPDAELSRLLEPWLGGLAGVQAGSAGGVPVPALIDVRLRGDLAIAAAAPVAGLRAKLAQAAPAAEIAAQAQWLRPVFDAIAALQWLALALVALLAAIGAAAVWLATRSALGAHRDSIEIVHLLGGTERQIARIFQRSIGFDALIGAAMGLVGGLAVVLVFARRFAALDAGIGGGGGMEWADWLTIAAIPVAAVALAVLTARLTVLAQLRRSL